MTPRERRELLKEETEGLNFFEKLEVRKEFDEELREGRANDQFEREADRLEDLYDRALTDSGDDVFKTMREEFHREKRGVLS